MMLAAPLTVALVVAVGPPSAAPPGAHAPSAPPPAWVGSNSRSAWATFGSYCWSPSGGSAACVDMLPPATRPDVRRLAVKPGSLVRLHVGFTPRSVAVYVLRGSFGRARLPATRAGRSVTWRARAGIADVELRGAGGSASYLIRLG